MTGRQVPVVPGKPIIGSLDVLREDSLAAYEDARRRYGDVVLFTGGPPGLKVKLYAVFSAAGAQQMLSAGNAANFRKDNLSYTEIRESFGDGLLTSQDEHYLHQRRLVQPLFTRRRTDGYADAVVTEARELTDRWAAASGPDGAEIDAAAEMGELALRVVARILFGADLESTVDVIRRNFPVMSDYVMHRVVSPVRLPRSVPTRINRRAAAARTELHRVCDRIIAERRAADEAPTADLLGQLAGARDENGQPLTGDDIRDQVLIFLFAGHETTATTLGFALHLLAGHPEVQRLARAEVDTVLGGREPAAADVDALPYLNMIVKETLRLYPSVAVLGRRTVEETELDGYHIPAGSDLYLSPWVIHRHPAYWDEPERFDPERFTPEREKARPRYAWVPFGGGPRACIGMQLSMLESVLSLATVLQRFECRAVDTEVPVRVGMTMVPDGTVRVRMAARIPA